MKITGGTYRAASAILMVTLGCSKTEPAGVEGINTHTPPSGGDDWADAGVRQRDAGAVSGVGGTAGVDGGVGSGGGPTDAGFEEARVCSPSAGASCPYVNCDGEWAAYPETMRVSGRAGIGTNGEPIESMGWRLSAKPESSTLASTAGDSSSFDFVPDVPGDYTWCISGTTASYDLAERCCQYRSVTDFQWSFDAATSTQSIDDIEFASGELLFRFEANQPFERTSAQTSSSRESVQVREAGSSEGSGSLALTVSLRHNDDGTVSDGGIQVGDTVAVQVLATPSIVGQAATMSGSIVLQQTTPPTNAAAPVITEVRSNLFVGAGGTVGVRLAEPPSSAVWLKIGGWDLHSTLRSIAVADDGKTPDAVAGDGWFTGRLDEFVVSFIEPCNDDGSSPDGGVCDNPNAGAIFGRQVWEPSTYSVLLRPQSDLGVGPYFRANLEWK
jgi:hypothetical protein